MVSLPLLCTGLKDSEALAYCTFGAACSEVELDVLTGEQRVLRCDILFDCGRSINPALDMGQVCSGLQSMDLLVVSPGADDVFHTLLTGNAYTVAAAPIWPPSWAMTMLHVSIDCEGYLCVSALRLHQHVLRSARWRAVHAVSRSCRAVAVAPAEGETPLTLPMQSKAVQLSVREL